MYADTLTTHLDYSAISSITVVDRDPGKVAGIVVGSLVTAVVTVGIVALSGLKNTDFSSIGQIGTFSQSDCNCPHVYTGTPDGTQHLEGSLYSGAIYPSLERSDYLPLLHLQPFENQYHIRLVNQESQQQHTNLLRLEVLDHAPGLQPVFDKYGHLHTLAVPEPPLSATDVSGNDVRSSVQAADEMIFFGDLGNEHPDATERLTLTFAKPARARQAKLLLRAKNSNWLDYTYLAFQNALGQHAGAMARKYRRLPAAKNLAWAERQKIPLAVWLETAPGHWEKAGYFHLAGTATLRYDVLSLDLSQVQGDKVRIRLDFGFHFWEVDYVALDFSADQPVQRTTLRPQAAIDQNGQDFAAALMENDDHYYDQPRLGDEARITFGMPPVPTGQVRSLVVHATGHYNILHPSTAGRPGLRQLKAWDKENALPRLSRERWQQLHHRTAHQ